MLCSESVGLPNVVGLVDILRAGGFGCSACRFSPVVKLGQADALPVISGASEFVVSASDILGRAQAALTGNELNTIQDKIGNVAAHWLRKPEIGPSLNADAAEFLF